MNQKRRDEITGLRGLSACIIAYIFHYTQLFHAMPECFPLQVTLMGALAKYGVCMSEIFFMLSGMLLYWSYQTRIADGALTLGQFILPKMKKIYPMMMVTALITWGLQNLGHIIYGVYVLHPDGAGVRNSIWALFVSLLGLQSGWFSDNDTLAVNGPSWFVSIFFICYVIYYLLTRYVKKESVKNACYIGMMVLGLLLMMHPLQLPLLYSTNGRGYFSFFAGIMLAQMMEKTSDEKKNIRCGGALLVFLGSLMLIRKWEQLFSFWYVSAFVWTSLLYLVCQVDILKKVFAWKPFVWLGNMCMPIFLWNMATDVMLELIRRACGWPMNYGSFIVWTMHVVVSLVVVWMMELIKWKQKR